MSGTFEHPPIQVLQYALVSDGLATLPESSGTWPVGVSNEVNSPDNVITIFRDIGRKQGRTMIDGEVQSLSGMQVRVRSSTYTSGETKMQAIQDFVDALLRLTVTISSAEYLIQSVTRTADFLHLGKEAPASVRQIFTLNLLVSLRQTS